MAKDTRLNIVVDNAQAIPAIDETGKAVEGLRERSRGATKGTKKDWGGITDLFQNVLPRSLSRSLRSFKSTGRQVGRLSRSFKGLKGAIASTGIGLLVIALGELVANWDAVSEAIGLTNKEQEENKKRTDEIRKAQVELTLEMQTYLETVKYSTASDEERAFAVNKLNKALGDVIDTEATRGEQSKQAEIILSAKLKLIQAEADLEDARNKKLVDKIALEKELESSNKAVRRKELSEEILDIEVEFLLASEALVTAETEINKLIVKGTELRNDRADAERKAAAATAKRKALEKSNASFLLQLEKDLNDQIFLAGIESEQKRAETELAMRVVEMEEKAKLAGASAEQLKLIEEGFLLDLAELRERYKEDEPDPQDIIDDQEALREQLRRVDLQENEKDVQQAQDLFDERMELAHGDRELEKQAEELFESEIDAIQVFYRDKKAADDQATVDKEIDDAQKVRDAKLKAVYAVANATTGIFANLEGLAEEGVRKQKHLAVTQVLLSQAVAISKAIEGATKAAADTGPAAPIAFVAYLATMLGGVLTAFRQVKGIMSQAGAGAGIGGSAGTNTNLAAPTVPLIPLGRQGSPDTNNQAYVVQSQLEGQNLNARQLEMQTVL
tara:strand:- start:9462 stop:11309 length:1848 start_codon:yes stop_codon:yes gene_type:complete